MNAVVSELRLPPHSVESEQAVLGGLLLDNSAFDRIADMLGEGDFYRRQHRLIFRAIERMIMSNNPADALTVADALADDLEDCGGQAYLGNLAVNAGSTANIRRYAEIVKERATRRRLAELCSVAQDALFSPAATPTPEIVGKLEAGLSGLAQRGGAVSRDIGTILTAVMERVDTLYKSDGNHLTGLSTGFYDLDEKTAGFQPGDLIVIAGRPSMGKTAIAMNIVEHVAKSGTTAAVFSLEMSDMQLVQRLLGSVARVNQHALRTGRLNDDDWNRITDGVGKLSDAPIVIEETNYLTAAELRARARRIARTSNLGLIVVDYLQLMATSGKNNRNEEVGDITRAMKTLAKELNVPVIALSQLNRGLESRPNKRPVMSDLRDSGNIEQDADVICFLYREEVYDEETLNKGVAELIIGKQRNGPTGTVRLSFRADITRFENFAGTYHHPAAKAPRGFQPGRQRADLEG